MSFSETIFLFFLALIIFGPKKLPEIARQIGKALNEFRRASNEFKAQIEHEISNIETEKKQTILPPTSPPEGTTSRTLAAAPVEASPAAEVGQSNPAESNRDGSNHSAADSSGNHSDNHSGDNSDRPVEDEPLFAAASNAVSSAPPTELSDPAPAPDEVPSHASQESHA